MTMKARTFLLAALAALAFGAPARAQVVNYTDLSLTVGASAVTIPNFGGVKTTALLCNSGSTNIAIGLSAGVTVGGSGSIELVPVGATGVGQNCLPFGPGTAPLGPLYAISSGAGGMLTVWVGTL